MLGILVVNKPQGLSSHDVVNAARRQLGTRRVGHAGTLDPQATGALVLAVGPATRYLQYLPLEPKVYEAEATFGVATDSQDGEGVITQESLVPADLQAQLAENLPNFRGEISQIPPMYSAVKVGGKPLYKMAREGEVIEREPRRVFIHEYEFLSQNESIVNFRIVCSGGTYVRTLVGDMGDRIGCGAYLSGLVRTAVGKFLLEDAIDLDAISVSRLIPLHEALKPMPMLALNARQIQVARDGGAFTYSPMPTERYTALLDERSQVFGIGRLEGPMVQPDCIIPREVMAPDSV